MSKIRTLGVLTSGGDCAGLNAVIRAVTWHATQVHGCRVLGILDGSLGLMERPPRYRELRAESFDESLFREGGTFLGTTNKGDPFQRAADFAASVRELGLDALIVIGGDGSMRILHRLCEQAGIGMVGVPKTIDNDVNGTEYAVGFATAINVVTDALDRLQPTAASHHRVMILEVMGRDTGHIALNGGLAGGADVILVPELPYSLEGLEAHLRQVLQRRSHALLVVAEGVKSADGQVATIHAPGEQLRYGGIGYYLDRELSRRSGLETRVTVLGHLQRGGTPSPRDRLLASVFGVHAVQLAVSGRHGRMVAWQNRGVVDIGLDEVTTGARLLQADDPLIVAARGVGIYVGDLPG